MSENFQTESKIKYASWGEAETTTMLDLVASLEEHLFGSFEGCSHLKSTNQSRSEMWRSITDQLNARFTNKRRSVTEIKKKYHNMKQRVKSKMDFNKKFAAKTGGGPPAKLLTNAEEHLIKALSGRPILEGLGNCGLDTDRISEKNTLTDTQSSVRSLSTYENVLSQPTTLTHNLPTRFDESEWQSEMSNQNALFNSSNFTVGSTCNDSIQDQIQPESSLILTSSNFTVGRTCDDSIQGQIQPESSLIRNLTFIDGLCQKEKQDSLEKEVENKRSKLTCGGKRKHDNFSRISEENLILENICLEKKCKKLEMDMDILKEQKTNIILDREKLNLEIEYLKKKSQFNFSSGFSFLDKQ